MSAGGTRAVVVTPVGEPAALAATCALARVAADVVPSEVGALAVVHDPRGDTPLAAGRAVSQLLKGALVVVLRNEGGQITSTGFTDGAETQVQEAGLWLDAAPVVLEDLITGAVEVTELDGLVSTAGMSRWRAARTLARLARQARKPSRDQS